MTENSWRSTSHDEDPIGLPRSFNQTHNLPHALRQKLQGVRVDACVKSKNKYPRGPLLARFGFSIVWLAMCTFMFGMMFSELFTTGKLPMTVNGSPKVYTMDTIFPSFPALFSLIFFGVGIVILVSALYQWFKPGAYYAVTEENLMELTNNERRKIDWAQFTGSVRQKKDALIFTLKSGKIVSNDNGSRYVADRIFINGLDEPSRLENLILKRIREDEAKKTVAN